MTRNRFKILTVILAAWSLVACNAGKNQTNIELIQDMMDQISVKSQDWDPAREGQGTAMVPPEGTVPRGHKPYKYQTDPIGAENNLKNPLSSDMTPAVLEVGKYNYEIYCMVCHGPNGTGNGPVAPKMALKPPSLLTDKVRNFKDGRIYHIITAGQGVMGAYSTQITDSKARWAIVNYVRTLQNKADAN